MKEGINVVSLVCNVILLITIFGYVIWTEGSIPLQKSEWKCSETIASGTDAVCLSYKRVQPNAGTTTTTPTN